MYAGEGSFDLSDSFVHSFSDVVDILGVEAYHCHSAVFQHVDVVFADHVTYLCFIETSEREHSDLVGDVLPVTRGV